MYIKSITAKKTATRLKTLREHSKLSQSQLAKQIKIKTDPEPGAEATFINMEGETGKQTISQLERGKRGLTIEMARVYADIFDVSLDYLYGRTNEWNPEYKTVKEQLDLSDGSISMLKNLKKNNHKLITTLDFFLNPKYSTSFYELITVLYDHSSMHQKISHDRNLSKKNGIEGFKVIQDYESKKALSMTHTDAEYISLFKIAEISKQLATEFKDAREGKNRQKK